MAYVDLHGKPFDDSTIAKLEIFEDYAQAWLPTFIMQGISPICVFDFFAGTGYDKNHIAGSPIRLLQKINEQYEILVQKNVKVQLYLNEIIPKKFQMLQEACEEFFKNNPKLKTVVNVQYENLDFEICFTKLLPVIEKHPSLVYLDQNGIKFLSEKYFLALEKTTQTDFLYFVSASYFWRFGDTEEFKMHLDIDIEKAKKDPYQFIHRNLLQQLRQKLPKKTGLRLYPFSIKKGANIHGIIFGATHIRAVEKFLALTWKRNVVNGEANFDIDKDIQKTQGDLFASGGKMLTKIEEFQKQLRESVLKGEVTNNIQTFIFAMEKGHIPEHARAEINKLKSEGFITFSGHSKISYNAWSEKDKVDFVKVKK